MKRALIIIFSFFSITPYAQVWESSKQWDEEVSRDFSIWISTDSFRTEIFSDPSSLWYGVETDCADSILAAQVIYAFQMGISFTLKLNSSNATLTNQSQKFNIKSDPIERVKSFIHFIGQSIGTEGLARYNSYPISLEQLRPGDFYIARWLTNGKYIRHASMIKEVLPTGHLVLYSSTTPVKVRELEVREGMPLHILSGRPWGFKRVQPFVYQSSKLEGYSLEQYDLLASVGDDAFFPRVIDVLKTQDDTLEDNLLRRVKNLCSQLQLRSREVNSTQRYLERIGHRCMNYSEYDEHSTPSRDKSLLNGIKRLLHGWKRIRKSDHARTLSSRLSLGLDSLLRKDNGQEARNNLKSLCEIQVNIDGKDVGYDLKNFFDLSMNSKVSSHPNDSTSLRWGAPGQKTSCTSFY